MEESRVNVILITVFIATLLNTSSADDSKSITEDCKRRCERTYPLHTYPKKDTYLACLRGCRLSAIDQLSSSNRSKENASKSCIAGCNEGYSEKDSQFACHVGCNEQPIIPTADSLYKKHKDAVGLWSISGYTHMEPIMTATQYCHGLMRKITYYVRISTAFYSSTQNGKTVVIKVNSPPQYFASISDAKSLLKDDHNVKIHVEKREHHGHGYAWRAIDKSKAWLHCVSRCSGLPFWLLSAVLFLGFAFMLWLCCTSLTTSHKEEKEKRLFVDDIFLLDGEELLNKKQPLMRSEEAEALPIKVNISATTI